MEEKLVFEVKMYQVAHMFSMIYLIFHTLKFVGRLEGMDLEVQMVCIIEMANFKVNMLMQAMLMVLA